MKGAKGVHCDCGKFLKPVYIRETFGKVTKLLECECGTERLITVDGSVYKEETKKDGKIIHSIRLTDFDKKLFRYQPRGKYRVASTIERK